MTGPTARPRDFEIRGRLPLTEQQLEDLADSVMRAPVISSFTHEASSAELAVRGDHNGEWGAVAIVLARLGRFAERVGVTLPHFAVTIHEGLTDDEAKEALRKMGMPWEDDDEPLDDRPDQ